MFDFRHQPGRVDGIYRSKYPPTPSPTPPPILADRCETITNSFPICSQLGYSKAFFPNFRLQLTPEEANKELSDFMPLLSCSNAIAHLLCSVYAPFCYEDSASKPMKLHPCIELCEYVTNGCREEVESFGLEWPEHLDCQNEAIFKPRNDTSTLLYCPPNLEMLQLPPNLTPPTMSTTTTTTVASKTVAMTAEVRTPAPTFPPVPPNARCEVISSIPMCSQIGYAYAIFPNHLHETPSEANQELLSMLPIISTQCSELLLHLLCSVNAPFCYERSGRTNILQPCNEMCHFVKATCEPVLFQFDLQWPTDLDCSDANIFRANSSLAYCPSNFTTRETTPTAEPTPINPGKQKLGF